MHPPPRAALVIVESAAKAKTIAGYLNGLARRDGTGTRYTVRASFGHIDNLPLKSLGVDKTTWTATYEPLADKKALIAELRKEIRAADFVYLASDNDLEGECIAYHLQTMFKLTPKNAARITFNEITEAALERAIANPRWLDANKIAAQESRRILDRLVGYEVSPLLWRRFPKGGSSGSGGLSAGRVQSAALKLVIDRDAEIAAFTDQIAWTLEGRFTGGGGAGGIEFVAKSPETAADRTAAIAQLEAARAAWPGAWRIHFTRKDTAKQPPAPFTTSTLQQEAYSRYSMNGKVCMQYAQQLYESGLITYMRTDSCTIAEEAMGRILGYVREECGDAEATPRKHKTRAKNAQEAHEAIRPVRPELTPEDLDADVAAGARKLYDLIRRRTLASVMSPARYADIHYWIVSEAGAGADAGIKLHGSTSILIKPGYLSVWSPGAEVGALDQWEELLKVGEAEVSPLGFRAVGGLRKPPAYYNEPALVKMLEKAGIGRPSTYAGIIDKLKTRGYVHLAAPPVVEVAVESFALEAADAEVASEMAAVRRHGSDAHSMIPTPLGRKVAQFLEETVSFITDIGFTSKMEAALDEIERAAKTKAGVLDEFHGTLAACLEAAAAARAQAAGAAGAAAADAPDGPRVITSRYGPALACGNGRFIGLNAFMEWRKIADITGVGPEEIAFLLKFPLAIAPPREVAIGPYGLYIRDTETGKNLPLDRRHWDAVYNGTLDPEIVRAASWEDAGVDKKNWGRGRGGGKRGGRGGRGGRGRGRGAA